MDREQTLAYQRGYAAGRSRRWPAHKPPLPPDPLVANLISALQQLRDATDSACAMFDESDEFVQRLDPAITIADEAMRAVSDWLAEADHPPAPPTG